MRLSIFHWQVLGTTFVVGALSSFALLAANPRPAPNARANSNTRNTSGTPKKVVRTAQATTEEGDAPSVMSNKQVRPAPATPITPAPRNARPTQTYSEGSYVEGEEISGEYHPGHHQEMHDPDFAGMAGYDESCLTGCCRPCNSGPVWIRADYIMWWRSGADLPPLATTAPVGTPQATAGEIGQPTTRILFGGDEAVDFPTRPGGRVEAGWWSDPCECFGVSGRFYWLGDANVTYAQNSTDSPILAIPFTEGFNNLPDARLVGYPGVFSGSLNYQLTSEVFGGDVYGKLL